MPEICAFFLKRNIILNDKFIEDEYKYYAELASFLVVTQQAKYPKHSSTSLQCNFGKTSYT